MFPTRRVYALLAGLACGVSGNALADDTDIFGTPRAPNVLFIADSSGSMQEYVPARTDSYNPSHTYTNACSVYDTVYREETRTEQRQRYDAECRGSPPLPPGNNDYCRVNARLPYTAENGTRISNCDAYDRRGNCLVRANRMLVNYNETVTVQVPVGTADTPTDLSSDYFYLSPKGPDAGSYTSGSVQCENSSEELRNANSLEDKHVGPIQKSRFSQAEIDTIERQGYLISGDFPDQWYVLGMNYRNWMLGNSLELPQPKGDLLKKVLAGNGSTNGLFDTINKVNIGLMRFGTWGRDAGYGGYVVHPIVTLDNERQASQTATNRTSLNDAVNAIDFENSTPLTETLSEAYRVFKGEAPAYGSANSVSASKNSSGRYISPVTASCDQNFVILLTDGQPTSDTGADNTVANSPTDYRGGCPNDDNGSCLDNLAEQMYATDFLPDVSTQALTQGTQNITTSTIGFDIDSPLLRDTARKGNGSYYTASSYGTLVDALENALGDVASASASFAPAGITVNQANQLRHSEDLYFALFQSGRRYHWDGNLKKYRLASDGTVQGLNASGGYVNAVDSNNAFRADVADRFAADRAVANVGAVDKGGAASRLPTGTAERTIYSDLSSTGTALSDDSNLVGLTDTLLSGAGVSDAEARNYGLGKNASGARHQILGDPLHSEPLLVHHNSTTSTVFMGSNDGFLHAFNASTGAERFAFLPSTLFGNLPRMVSTQRYANGRAYGMDGPLTSYVIDHDHDGVIETADQDRVIVYAGMRRGGAATINPGSNTLYALDVTTLATPKLLFALDNTDSGLAQLAQTWSPANVVTFKRGRTGTALNALVMGGGYDPRYDDDTEPPATTNGTTPGVTGNRIYLLNPLTGARLATLNTDYSVPSEVRVVDINDDGFADTLYAVDIKGNLYRWQIADNTTSISDTSFTGGKIASLSGTGDQARRFFYAPEVATMTYNGSTFVTVVVGSGNREKPLDTTIEDGIFVVWDTTALSFGTVPRTAVSYEALTNVTNNVVPEGTSGSAMSAIAADGAGWRIMLGSGEKVLGGALIADKKIYLTSYSPGTSVACSSIRGGGNFYAMSYTDGRPVYDLNQPANNDPSALTAADRSSPTGIAGINTPPALVLPSAPPEGGPGTCEQFVLVNNKAMCISEGERVQRTKWRRR